MWGELGVSGRADQSPRDPTPVWSTCGGQVIVRGGERTQTVEVVSPDVIRGLLGLMQAEGGQLGGSAHHLPVQVGVSDLGPRHIGLGNKGSGVLRPPHFTWGEFESLPCRFLPQFPHLHRSQTDPAAVCKQRTRHIAGSGEEKWPSLTTEEGRGAGT